MKIAARSTKEGIVFYSELFPKLIFETRLTDSREFVRTVLKDRYKAKGNKIYCGTIIDFNYVLKNVIGAILVMLSLGLFLFLYEQTGEPFFFAIGFTSIFFLMTSFSTFIMFWIQMRFGAEKSTASFHAAANKTLNAYNKLQRVPTLKEVKNESIIYKNCESIDVFSNIFINIAVLLYFTQVHKMTMVEFSVIGVAIIVVLQLLILDTKCLAFLQILFLKQPSDEQLELAIKGIQAIESRKEWYGYERD